MISPHTLGFIELHERNWNVKEMKQVTNVNIVVDTIYSYIVIFILYFALKHKQTQTNDIQQITECLEAFPRFVNTLFWKSFKLLLSIF